MRIGLVCPYNVHKGGGVQECVLAMQTELQRRGHYVKILTPQPREIKDVDAKDIIYIGRAADVKSPFHTTAQISVSLDNEAIDRVLSEEKFDILHFHEPWVPMVSLQILMRSQSRNVATFHAKLPETVMSRTIERVVTPYTRSIMKYLPALTAVSEAAAQYVRSITDKPVSIIPNGIDLKKYRASTPGATSKNTILFIGRLERRKGVKYLLEAFKVLAARDAGVQLCIAGDGPDREKLEMFVHEQGIPRVTFLGFVSEDKKLKLLAQARLFVSPALYGESFGIVLLEAMAAGVPVVAGNNPGYKSVMQGVGELSIVNPRDTEEFARRLQLLVADETLRKHWQTWAKPYVEQFAYHKVVDQYEALYQKLLA